MFLGCSACCWGVRFYRNDDLKPRYAPGKWALCIALACLDNVALLTSVLGSGNNKVLAKESNAPASNGLKNNREEEGS